MATTLTAPNGTITGGAIAPPVSMSSPTYQPTQTPTNPTVVTSSAANTDLNNIQNNLKTTQTGIATQSQAVQNIIANMKAQDAVTAKAAQDKAVADSTVAANTAKTNALSGGVSNPTSGQTANNNSNLPAGWDAVTYSNFKSANPTLEPTPEDTARMKATGTYEPSEADKLSQQMYQQAQDTAQKITDIQNGTIPLSAGEQAQVNDLKNQFQNLIQQTQTANANYQQGLQILGAESGRERYTPETHLGSMQDAVNKGIQKISDLNSQMSAAVAKLEQGFRDGDIATIKEANATYQTAAKDRVDFLNKMTADATAAVKDQRDFAYKQQQDLIQNTMKSNEFDYKKTQDAIDNAFKQGQLTETQRHDMADEALKRAAQAGVDTGGIPGLPQVNMTGDNTPNSADQAKFLASLPTDVATLVKGIADYNINLTTSPQKQYKGAAGLTQAQMAALVLQYDPTFSQAQFATRQAYQKSLQSGQIYQGIVSGNKAINHLVSFADTVSKLGNIYPFSGLNKASQAATAPFSGSLQSNMATASTEANGLKDELAKFFKGTGTSDIQSISDWSKSLDTGANSSSLHGTVQGAINLLAGQLDVVTQGYTSTMGKAPTNQILQPATIQKLSALKNQGYQVDIPGVYYTDKDSYFKYGGGSADTLKQAYDYLQNLNDPQNPPTPENVLQLAQLQQ